MYLLTHRVRITGFKKAADELRHEMGKTLANRYRKIVEAVLLDAKVSKDEVNVLAYLHQKFKTFTPVLPDQLDMILGTVAGSDTSM